jgi:hypothetical protein
MAWAQDQAVTPGEIKSTWVGKKVFGRASNGGLLDFAMLPDGSASLAVGNFSDTGVWRLTETGYCAKWTKLRGGQEGCFTVVRRGSDVLVLNPDGSTNVQVLRVQ